MIGRLFASDSGAICAIIPGRARGDFWAISRANFRACPREPNSSLRAGRFPGPFLGSISGPVSRARSGPPTGTISGPRSGRSTTSAWTDLQAMRFSDWNYQRIVASRLPAAEKLLLLILDVRWGRCSQSELAGYLSVTERRVRQLVAGLQRQGVLEITPSWREKQYRVIFDKLVQSAS